MNDHNTNSQPRNTESLHNTVVVIRRGVVYIMYKGVVNIATSNNAVATVNRYHISNNALIVLHLLG